MQEKEDIQIAKLFEIDIAYSRSLVDIYIGSASSAERSTQKILCIIECPRTLTGVRDIIDVILKKIAVTFNRSRHATPTQTLEEILDTLNTYLPELNSRKSNTQWIDSLNMLVAIADRGQIHCAQIGAIHSLLIHQGAVTSITDSPERLNPVKIFSHITSGVLEPGNALIFCTHSLLDYVSLDKIRQLVSTLSPDVTVRNIESLIASVPSNIAFAAIIMKHMSEYDELVAEKMQVTAKPATQTVTRPTAQIQDTDRSVDVTRRRSLRKPLWLRMLLFVARHAYIYFSILATVTARAATISLRTIKSLFSFSHREREEMNIIASTMSIATESISRIRRLSRIRSVLFMGLITLIIVLLNIILFRSIHSETAIIQRTFDQTLALISDRKQDAELAMTMKDERKAEQLLSSIDSMLRGVSTTNKKEQDDIARFIDENLRELNKLRHVNFVSTPLVNADLSSITEPFVSLSIVKDTTYAATAHILYRIDQGKPIVAAETKQTIQSLFESRTTPTILTNTRTIERLQDTNLTPTTITLPADGSLDAVNEYGDNLYMLDRTRHIILKFTGSAAGGYGSPFTWSNDVTSLANAYHFSIDGNIFLTTSKGEIVKLLKGKPQKFAYPSFNPALGSHTKIYTTKDSNNLYLLDRDNKRISIIDKQGMVKAQFVSPKFDDLLDLAISTSEESLSILNGHTIYLIAVPK